MRLWRRENVLPAFEIEPRFLCSLVRGHLTTTRTELSRFQRGKWKFERILSTKTNIFINNSLILPRYIPVLITGVYDKCALCKEPSEYLYYVLDYVIWQEFIVRYPCYAGGPKLLAHGSPTRGAPVCIMWPTATLFKVFTIKITQ